MIDFNTFLNLYAEAEEYDSEEMYALGRGWQEWMDGIADVGEITSLLHDIYDMSRNGFQAIMERFRNLRHLAEVLCVPYSTAQKWKAGTQKPPKYTAMLMAYATIGLVGKENK